MRRPRREGRDRARRFSPGLAARIACYDGRRWFVKAASGQVNPGTPRLHRQEAGILRGLDPLIRSGQLPTPQLRATAGHGSWFALITDDIDGRHPALPPAAFAGIVLLAPSVAMQGGPEPADLPARSPAGRPASPAGVSATVCALAGYFTERSLRPPPPGLPTARAFQAAHGEITRR